MRKGDAMTMDELPPLVARANALAIQMGFPLTRQAAAPGVASACLPGVGLFLAVLAAGCRGGRIAEAGTDAKRQLFTADPRLVSAEVVLPDLQNSLLVGTRIG